MDLLGHKKQKPDITALTKKGDIPGLIQALTNDDFEIQIAAAKSLGSLGPVAIGTVLKKLKTRNRALRLGIIEALAVIKDPLAVDPLLDALDDQLAEVRWGCAIALGEIGDDRAIPRLKKTLGDKDKYVRYGAAFALAKIGWKPETSLDKARLFYGMQEWGALKEMGISAISVLETARKDADLEIRLKALDLLGAIHDKSVAPSLIGALADENSTCPLEIGTGISKSGNTPDVPSPRHFPETPYSEEPEDRGTPEFPPSRPGIQLFGKMVGDPHLSARCDRNALAAQVRRRVLILHHPVPPLYPHRRPCCLDCHENAGYVTLSSPHRNRCGNSLFFGFWRNPQNFNCHNAPRGLRQSLPPPPPR